MSGPKGLINLSDPPTPFRGFRDGEECMFTDDRGTWVGIFHKGKNGKFDWIERIRSVFDDTNSIARQDC